MSFCCLINRSIHGLNNSEAQKASYILYIKLLFMEGNILKVMYNIHMRDLTASQIKQLDGNSLYIFTKPMEILYTQYK